MDDKVIPLPECGEIDPAGGLFVSSPGPEPDVFTEINGQPLWWQDFGRKHACEGAEIAPNGIAMWTLCPWDVAPPEVFHPEARDKLTCEGCIAVGGDRQSRQNFEEGLGVARIMPDPANDG